MTGLHPTADRVTHFWSVDDVDGLDFDPLLARLMREAPLSRIRFRFGEGDAWLVTRYRDIRSVVSDARFSRAATLERPVTSMTPHVIGLPGAPGRADPPDHTRLRRLLAQSFTPRRVTEIRPHAEAIADGLLRDMAAEGPPGDLVGSFTGPLSTQVISELLGVPRADWPQMHEWRRILMSRHVSEGEANSVKGQLRDYFANLAGRLRIAPGDDAYSALVAAREAGELGQAELVSLAMILLLNGLESARATLIYALLTHPDQHAELTEEGLPQAIEELLRYIPHRNGAGLPSIATEDVEVCGATIRAGEAMYVSYLAANRDREVFDDPDRLDLGRTQNPHMAFGHGAHFCAGAALARMQSQVMISSLLRHFPRLRLACPADQVPWRRGAINRGPESLPVTW